LKKSHQFCGRGPCVPPSVEGQCFHLRRLDLQICPCLAPVARYRIARTCVDAVWVFSCCDNLRSGKCIWGICDKTCKLWLRETEWYLFGQEKRMDCAHGVGGCDAVACRDLL